MSRLALYIDEIFKLGLIFLISLIFYRATMLTLAVCLFLASITTIIIGTILFYIKLKKKNKLLLKNEQIKKIENIKNQFINASRRELCSYFAKLLSAHLNNKCELIKTIDEEKILYIPYFEKDLFDLDDLLSIYRKNKNKQISQIIILCSKYSDGCYATSKNYKKITYKLLNLNDIYLNLIEPTGIYPNIMTENVTKEKMNFSRLKAFVFERKRAKSYIFCGTILLFSSYFVPLRIYYLIFAGLLFLFALLCICVNKTSGKI